MDYIIEDTIRFNTKDRSLTHVETSDNIFLAMPGCFLLEYLVKNQGTVFTRNQLLDDIFKKNELVDSDCNLSQNVSMLRKSFRDLGISKDVLLTKPRIGLLLSEEVKVTEISQPPVGTLKKNSILSPGSTTSAFCCPFQWRCSCPFGLIFSIKTILVPCLCRKQRPSMGVKCIS